MIREILLQPYLDYEHGSRRPELRAAPTMARRERSSDIARADRRPARRRRAGTSRPWSTTSSSAAQGRHVLAWSSKPEQQRGWVARRRLGRAPGRIPSSLALQNRVRQQARPVHCRSQARFEHRAGHGVAARSRCGIHIENQTPTEGLNSFVAGPVPLLELRGGGVPGDPLGQHPRGLPGDQPRGRHQDRRSPVPTARPG